MAKTGSSASTEGSLLAKMLLGGAAVGTLFPIGALLFVEARSSSALILFWVMAISAGLFMGFFCHLLAQRVARALLADVLSEVASRLGVAVESKDGTAVSREALVDVVRRASVLLERAQAVSNDIRALTAQVLAATEQQASGAAEQAAAVSQTSATVEQLAQTSKQIAENSSAVVAIAERTLASAEEGMHAVADTADGIEEIRTTTIASSDRILALGERSQEIGRVLVIIDEIAEQTKILALNAAIEAARAGEAGRGFSVVAEEIRKLAESVTESTQEIGRVVREIQASTSSLIMSTERAAKKVEEGKKLAHQTAGALDRIVSQVEETTDAAKQISIATQQQRTASDQVVFSMREVAQVSRQAAEASRQIASAITDLDRLADSLHNVR